MFTLLFFLALKTSVVSELRLIINSFEGLKNKLCVSDKLRTTSSPLRGALQAQASRFVTRFHDERRNKLSLILDNELWKQVCIFHFASFCCHNVSTE